MARTFDAWLPYIQPVAERLIALLQLKPGLRVLDVACGTGEPGLTIARRWKGEVEVVGTDAAQGMIDVCIGKAAAERLKGISHLVKKAEALDSPDGTFDRVTSRFGVMLFDEPVSALRQMTRVLRPGGRMVFSVWSAFERVQAAAIPFRVFSNQFPENERPPEPQMGSLGQPGKLEALLSEAGIQEYSIEPIHLTYTFDAPEDLWRLVIQSGSSRELYEKLNEEQRKACRRALIEALAPFRRADKIVLSNEALIVVVDKRPHPG